mmetsp:Transcript_34644/g.56407  ORF Transcript_34644/g.56407 Transcript_34644/m.56407 type:complete len:80 (+) Transcript_34644:77-316(+)
MAFPVQIISIIQQAEVANINPPSQLDRVSSPHAARGQYIQRTVWRGVVWGGVAGVLLAPTVVAEKKARSFLTSFATFVR